ncbi:MAG: polysaccharide biosynthesis C-terminal domain-containing protein [Bacteroidota bacterium]
MKINKHSILNLFIRGLTILSRFILLFCFGKFFSTDDLGTYGIFYTTVNLCLMTLGLDFYTFSNREVLYAETKDRFSVLRNQLLFYLFTYAVFLLPMLLIFTYGVIPIKYVVFFYIILVFEHLSQEFYRLFTILSFPILANWLLFLRNGLWVVILIIVYWLFGINEYSLSVVFIGWMIGSGLSVVIGFYKVIRLYGGYPAGRIEKSWFYSGIKTSALYFLSTIALITIDNLNRYLIKYWCGLSKVGVFTFFSQISNIINVIIFTLFIMVIYPKLVEAANSNDREGFFRLKNELLKKVVVYSFSIGVLLIVFIFPMLYFINKPEYYAELNTFYLLVISTIFLNISLVNHYVLYAFKKDSSLLYSTLIGAVASVLLNLFFISHFSILGAALSLSLSYLVLIITKSLFSKKAEADFIQKNILSGK